jgi:hypothetical protein
MTSQARKLQALAIVCQKARVECFVGGDIEKRAASMTLQDVVSHLKSLQETSLRPLAQCRQDLNKDNQCQVRTYSVLRSRMWITYNEAATAAGEPTMAQPTLEQADKLLAAIKQRVEKTRDDLERLQRVLIALQNCGLL